jgi:hypothetical protein
MENPMNRKLLLAIAVVALMIGGSQQSSAQGVGVQVGPVGAGITFAPEHRTRVRTYIRERNVRPVTIRERVRVGATLPTDVELMEVPEEWGPEVRRYRYVYAGDDIIFVEPGTRKVVQVLD